MKTILEGGIRLGFTIKTMNPASLLLLANFPVYQGSCNEEPTRAEHPLVVTLSNLVNDLKAHGLT
jgi:hypothetical protein